MKTQRGFRGIAFVAAVVLGFGGLARLGTLLRLFEPAHSGHADGRALESRIVELEAALAASRAEINRLARVR